MLFARQDTVEAAWRVVDPVLDDAVPVHRYPRGTWGPEEADALLPERRQLPRPGRLTSPVNPASMGWTHSCHCCRRPGSLDLRHQRSRGYSHGVGRPRPPPVRCTPHRAPRARVVFAAAFALMVLDFADRQVVVATFPAAADRVGVVGRAARRARVGGVRHGGARRLPGCAARGPVEPGAGDRPHGHGLEPRRGGGGSRPEFRPTPHRARGPRRRRGRLRPGRRGAAGNDVPPGPPRHRPRSVPGGGAAGRDAGGGPRRRGRGALGVARGVLGLRAPRVGRGVAVPACPGLSDGAAGRRDGCSLGGGRRCGSCSGPGPGRPGTPAALSSWWSSRRSTRGCPASCTARTACRSTGQRRPPRWSSSPGSPA